MDLACTVTSTFPWDVTASAAIWGASPRTRISRPRSAPACSIAARMSLSRSLSRIISPEIACETSITVARSRFSTGSLIVLVAPGTGSASRRYG